MKGFKILSGIGGAITLFSVLYAAYTQEKMNKVSRKLDVALDNLAESTIVDVQESMIEEAVQVAVNRATHAAVKEATKQVVSDIKSDMHRQIKTAVDISYSELKKTISDDMVKQAANIDMRELKDEVTNKAKEKVLEKFDDSLDSILEKYNRDLDNVGKIYRSIAKNMSKED